MTSLDPTLIRQLVRVALAEDRASEDVTTAALIPPDQRGRATILAKAEGVLAGLPLAEAAFAAVDESLAWTAHKSDGDRILAGDRVIEIEGSLASILRAERVALNFLTHLSGVATAAAEVVRALDGTGCCLRDTRKTIPGLRLPEKYAVQMGGGTNHRLDLADGILIKDNHLAALRARGATKSGSGFNLTGGEPTPGGSGFNLTGLGVADAVRLAREAHPGMRVEIEVEDVEEAREAIKAGADELLLDNMSPGEMRKVVALVTGRDPRPVLEASGGITLANARLIAETGVDYISMGAITHSAPALDLSLDVEAG
jgi:nicotinate-nucleotide pyrophosphorylase (carboxylating)